MSKQLLSVVAICSLALPAVLFSQTPATTPPEGGRIIGTVVTANVPLAAAAVTVRGSLDTATIANVATAADGRFVVDKLPFGSFTVRVSFLGYKTRIVENVQLTRATPTADLGVLKLDASMVARNEATAVGAQR